MPREKQRKHRLKGTGSVHPRKDGRWAGSFIREDTGKRKYVYGKTEKEAEAKLRKALEDQQKGILTGGPQRKLGDHLTWWLEEVHRLKIRENSYIRYRAALEKHIIPALGNIPLQKLTTQKIQTFYNEKLRAKQSPSSVHTMHKVIHKGLEYARRSRLIGYNPSDDIVLPAQTKRKVTPLTVEQARHLLNTAKGHPLEGFLTLALATGMRHGELAALRWEDVDFVQGTIHIHRTIAYHGKRRIEGAPKTEAGERIIPISEKVCDLMEQHRARQEELRLKAGAEWKDYGLVFASSTGDFLVPLSVRTQFYRLLEKAGLPPMHIHDLRHTASTLLRSMGVDVTVRQAILGHAHADQTLDYSHVLPGDERAAAKKMDCLFE